jgi:hypothetical protein
MCLGTDNHEPAIIQFARLNQRNPRDSLLSFDEAASISYPMFISVTTAIFILRGPSIKIARSTHAPDSLGTVVLRT